MYIQYVGGLFFDKASTKLALIEKRHPVWQAGNLNAIGGKVEPNEPILEAMRREFREETGLDVPEKDWQMTVHLMFRMHEMYIFRTYGDLTKLKTTTDEEVKVFELDHIPTNLVLDLDWLIKLSAAQHLKFPLEIEELD